MGQTQRVRIAIDSKDLKFRRAEKRAKRKIKIYL